MLRCILICVFYMLLKGFIQPFFSIQLKCCTLPVSISLSRLIMVLQMMVLSETVVILVIHKACDTEVKLPLIE